MMGGGSRVELRALETGSRLKSCPLAIGAIGSLKAFFTSRLDFELPEDYKDRCPIFCSR